MSDAPSISRDSLGDEYAAIRSHTEEICKNLSPEDQCIQSMPDASPAKWHRAHTTWFFEAFLLEPHAEGYVAFDRAFSFLYNSYYETAGPRHSRLHRGLITRPSATEIGDYRRHVDAAIQRLLSSCTPQVGELIRLGLQHEQQHQELLITDMLHALAQNPLAPELIPGWTEPVVSQDRGRMFTFEGGVGTIGAGDGFSFDSETPRHDVLVQPFRIAERLVRNEDYLLFVEDGGYRSPTLWMSDGWEAARANGWTCPLYWENRDGAWLQTGLGGLAELVLGAPVRHVSWYEADAYARWAAARLPTEQEWEIAATDARMSEVDTYAWQWTASAYRPYPGYIAPEGAIGEYNGKFMINQMVLRGGSLATPAGHTRPSYRNFFHPDKRWQFSGVRLAADC